MHVLTWESGCVRAEDIVKYPEPAVTRPTIVVSPLWILHEEWEMTVRNQLDPVVTQWLIIGFAVVTGLIHLYLAFQFPNGPDLVFTLNGIGYLVLVALLYWPLPQLTGWRKPIRWLLLAYTALTVVLWVVVGARNAIAYLDKLVEVALIVLLWMEMQRG